MTIALHELIKTLREERNWSVEDLAKKMQVGIEKMNAYESGTAIPSIQTLLKLSNVLEVPASNLTDRLQNK